MAISLPIVSKFDDKGVNQADSAIGKLQGTLKTFAGIAIAAFSVDAIVDFGRSAILAAEDAQVANNRLDAISKSMGLFGDQTAGVTKRIKSFADELALSTGVEDEAIKAAQAQLLTFKNLAVTADDAGGAFDRATKAVLDLSAAGLGSLDTSAVQLGKALQDPIKGIAALGRAGVTFTEEQKGFIASLVESGDLLGAQDYLLSAIETQVGGTAEATATASDRMKVAWGEIQETVGALLLPAFETFAQWVVDNFPAIQSEIENVGENIRVTWEKVQPVFAELKRFLEEDFVPGLEVLLPKVGALLNEVGRLLTEPFAAFNTEVEKTPENSNTFITSIGGIIDVLTNNLKFINDTGLALQILGEWMSGEISTKTFYRKLVELGGQFETMAMHAWRTGQAIRDAFEGAIAFLQSLPARITIIFAVAGTWLYQAGKNIVDGLLNGIRDNFWTVIGFLTGGITNIIDIVKKGLGIKSPSKVFTSIGADITAGLVKGLQAGQVDVSKAVAGMSANVETSFNTPLTNVVEPADLMGVNGGSSATYSVTVNAGIGTNGVQVGQEIIKAISQFERGNGRVFARA